MYIFTTQGRNKEAINNLLYTYALHVKIWLQCYWTDRHATYITRALEIPFTLIVYSYFNSAFEHTGVLMCR